MNLEAIKKINTPAEITVPILPGEGSPNRWFLLCRKFIFKRDYKKIKKLSIFA